jgi:hypothetical protein
VELKVPKVASLREVFSVMRALPKGARAVDIKSVGRDVHK